MPPNRSLMVPETDPLRMRWQNPIDDKIAFRRYDGGQVYPT